MVKTNLILCDVCKDKVGKIKCNLCNKDLCDSCKMAIQITISRAKSYEGNSKKINIILCIDCNSNLVNATNKNENFFDDNFMNKLKREVVDYIKKGLILKNL